MINTQKQALWEIISRFGIDKIASDLDDRPKEFAALITNNAEFLDAVKKEFSPSDVRDILGISIMRKNSSSKKSKVSKNTSMLTRKRRKVEGKRTKDYGIDIRNLSTEEEFVEVWKDEFLRMNLDAVTMVLEFMGELFRSVDILFVNDEKSVYYEAGYQDTQPIVPPPGGFRSSVDLERYYDRKKNLSRNSVLVFNIDDLVKGGFATNEENATIIDLRSLFNAGGLPKNQYSAFDYIKAVNMMIQTEYTYSEGKKKISEFGYPISNVNCLRIKKSERLQRQIKLSGLYNLPISNIYIDETDNVKSPYLVLNGCSLDIRNSIGRFTTYGFRKIHIMNISGIYSNEKNYNRELYSRLRLLKVTNVPSVDLGDFTRCQSIVVKNSGDVKCERLNDLERLMLKNAPKSTIIECPSLRVLNISKVFIYPEDWDENRDRDIIIEPYVVDFGYGPNVEDLKLDVEELKLVEVVLKTPSQEDVDLAQLFPKLRKLKMRHFRTVPKIKTLHTLYLEYMFGDWRRRNDNLVLDGYPNLLILDMTDVFVESMNLPNLVKLFVDECVFRFNTISGFEHLFDLRLENTTVPGNLLNINLPNLKGIILNYKQTTTFVNVNAPNIIDMILKDVEVAFERPLEKVESLVISGYRNSLPMLGEMPNLKNLAIKKQDLSDDDEFEIANDVVLNVSEYIQANNLQNLKLDTVFSKELIFEDLPSIKKLSVRGFYKSLVLPHMPKLKKMSLDGVGEGATIRFETTTPITTKEFILDGSVGDFQIVAPGGFWTNVMIISNCMFEDSDEDFDEEREFLLNQIDVMGTVYIDKCQDMELSLGTLESVKNIYVSNCKDIIITGQNVLRGTLFHLKDNAHTYFYENAIKKRLDVDGKYVVEFGKLENFVPQTDQFGGGGFHFGD